jgi:hypothetical protein
MDQHDDTRNRQQTRKDRRNPKHNLRHRGVIVHLVPKVVVPSSEPPEPAFEQMYGVSCDEPCEGVGGLARTQADEVRCACIWV